MPVRVLIVDDCVPMRDILRHHLECIGCEVVAEAESGLQALDLIRTVSPSLVVLDVGTAPDSRVGSLALFRRMRLENPQARILVVSPIAFPEIREVFVREGAVDCVLKPFDGPTFQRVCNRLVRLFPELALEARGPYRNGARPGARIVVREPAGPARHREGFL